MIYPEELAAYQAAPDILKFFLFCLCGLHAYWIILMWNMYIRAIVGGDTDDKQRNTENLDKQKFANSQECDQQQLLSKTEKVE